MATPMSAEPEYDVTTVGETLLRISVAPGATLETAGQAALHAGGSESNVACALARLGRRVAWHSRLPRQPLGRHIANTLREAGIDLSLVEWCDDGRLGTYYVELRLPPTPVRVVYDRADSCASHMAPGTLPVEALLRTRLLHLTGITPALSTSCREAMLELAEAARRRCVPFSLDLNYRRKLWAPDEARETLLKLGQGAAMLFSARADAGEVLGLEGDPASMVRDLRDAFEARVAVLSLGRDGLVAWDGETLLRRPAAESSVIDRLGAGDAQAAGIIHGWLDGDLAGGLEIGTALAALCLRTDGDAVVIHPDDLPEIVAADSARPLR